ncbi:unnamed protein product [Haemonchus placei]|uniref:Haloacid dehalogenase-like hydrolase domain-containing protein 3 n=1 Tax=Haemonchus placei TaxID=6290 RepID=A0A0N4WEL1_HAEPC|nr:unnamed protein product [Haemonchus placei]
MTRFSSAIVRVVSIDAMDTIITTKEPISNVYTRVAGEFGFVVNSSDIASAFPGHMKKLFNSHPCFGYNSIGSSEWWRRLVQGCLQEMKAVIGDFRHRGLGVAVVSNFDGRLKKILRELELLPLFDIVVASGEVGVEKPDPSIFKLVMKHYGLSNASGLLHVGDNFEKDYKAVRDIGGNSVLFDPSSSNREIVNEHRITSFSELKVE